MSKELEKLRKRNKELTVAIQRNKWVDGKPREKLRSLLNERYEIRSVILTILWG